MMKRIMVTWYLSLFMGVFMAGTALAAEPGWKNEDGVLRFVDKNGNYVTKDWRTKDGDSYYLDGDGEIVKDAWIDQTYYVNEKGVMVKNDWVYSEGKEGEKAEGWYYMGRNGKFADGWKNIGEGRYNFDPKGRMRTGWYYEKGETYYFGEEDGAMWRGWLCLEFDEDNPPKEGEIAKEYRKAGEDARWFFFQNNGKAKKSPKGTYEQENIHGKKYYFDQNGAMLTGWQPVREKAAEKDASGVSRFVYLGGVNDGAMVRKQWKQLSVHPSDREEEKLIAETGQDGLPKKGQKEWYYFKNNGSPAYLEQGAASMDDATVETKSGSYFVNEYGCRRTGLVKILSGDKTLTGYFGAKGSDGQMQVGKQTGIQDEDGQKLTFYFNTAGGNKGAGYSGEKDGYLYYNGLLVTADGDSDYEVYQVENRYYLVDRQGKVQTQEKAYKADGDYAYRIEGRNVYYTDDSGAKTKEADVGSALPDFACEQVYEM